MDTDTVPEATLRQCLVAATMAPSVHNTQPWLFRIRGGAVEIFADERRRLRSLDPDGREMRISVGGAIFTLRLALHARGWATGLDLAPRDCRTAFAGRVTVTGRAAAPRAVRSLADAIPRRHTNRRPFADVTVPAAVLAELATAAAAQGANLVVAELDLRRAILGLTRTAEHRQREDPAYLPELRQWVTSGAPGRRDGVPRHALGPRATETALPLRDFLIAHGLPVSTVDFEAEPALLLLRTDRDTHRDWLAAGMALQSVLLTATCRGLAATPLSQLTEIAELRELIEDQSTGEVVQMVLRLGYALHPAVATPRRDLGEVLL